MHSELEALQPENDELIAPRKVGAEEVALLLDKVKISEVLSTDEARKEFLKNLSFDEFVDFLVRVNGISRGIPITQREVDGKDVVLNAGMFGVRATPEYEDKRLLLEDLYHIAQTMDDLESAGLLLGAGINTVHPFMDGNGRTSRLVFSLLRDGYSGSDEDHRRVVELLDEKGRKKLDLAPTFIQHELAAVQGQEAMLAYMDNPTLEGYDLLEKDDFQEDIPSEKKERLIKMVYEGHQDFALLAIYHFLLSNDGFEDKYFKIVPDTSHYIEDDAGRLVADPNYSTKTVIPINILIPELSEKDIDEILNNNTKAKRDYVYLLADAIAHPEKYPYPDTHGWNDYSNLQEYFLHTMTNRHKEYFNQHKK